MARTIVPVARATIVAPASGSNRIFGAVDRVRRVALLTKGALTWLPLLPLALLLLTGLYLFVLPHAVKWRSARGK